MAQNKIIDDLLAEELSRKEFLTRVGVIGLSVVGFGSLLATLSGGSRNNDRQSHAGFGTGPYGGAFADGSSPTAGSRRS